MMLRTSLIAALTLTLPAVARAQCSDGTQSPCKAAAVARRDPPINEQLWLVLPFDNAARAPDADLISQASATLLTQELSRWRDVQVVPDDRVADLLRQLPEAQRRAPGLEASIGMAKRVGAGRILMGSFLAVGGRANLDAKVYETRTGNQVRVASDRVRAYSTDAGLDSLSAAFGRLGRSVLNVQATAERGGAVSVGTTSIMAYREYALGIAAIDRSRPDSAVGYLRRALALDSAFALAHVYLGVALNSLGDLDGSAANLAASARFLESLSPRMRLIVAFWRGNNASQCATSSGLLRADSADMYGWLALGWCNVRTGLVTATNGVSLAGNRNAAVRAFARAMELDPTSSLPLRGAISALVPSQSSACRVSVSVAGGVCPMKDAVRGGPAIVADTIVYTAQPYDPFHAPNTTPAAATAAREMLRRAQGLAERWTATLPADWLGHWNLSYVLLGQGDLVGAARELAAAHDAALIPQARRFYYRDRAELELRRERPTLAAAYIDSMFLDRTANQQPYFQTVLGRFSLDRFAADPPGSEASRTAFMTLFSGAVPANADSLTRAFGEYRASRSGDESKADVRWGAMTLATILGFHARRTGPALDTGSTSALLRFQSFLARGDSARARRELLGIDDEVSRFTNDLFDDGTLLFAAESHLELGDSTTALRLMQGWASNWPRYWMNLSVFLPFGILVGVTGSSRLAGREWLLYADLCMARGLNDEARRGYRMVVGLWERGEPPVQPMVARAKAALAKLGG